MALTCYNPPRTRHPPDQGGTPPIVEDCLCEKQVMSQEATGCGVGTQFNINHDCFDTAYPEINQLFYFKLHGFDLLQPPGTRHPPNQAGTPPLRKLLV